MRTYKYILVYTGTYQYVLVYTSSIHIVFWCWGAGVCAAGNTTPQSHTSLASTGVRSSPWDVQTLQLQMAGVAAMCMRSTRGCGTLAVASHAWVVWLLRLLPSGRKLGGRTKPGVLHSLVGTGGRMVHDQVKFAVFWSIYQYVPVCTSMYQYVLWKF
jgi:hypothetical protein